MNNELKIRIEDLKKMRAHLLGLGAKFDKEITVKDTYFNQKEGEVLKVSETNEGDFLVHLKAKAGGFDYLQNDRIDNAGEVKEELTKKFGIRSVLNKKRQFYKLNNYVLDINIIDKLGNFLVIIGPDISKDTLTKELSIKSPEFITVPFDKLSKGTTPAV